MARRILSFGEHRLTDVEKAVFGESLIGDDRPRRRMKRTPLFHDPKIVNIEGHGMVVGYIYFLACLSAETPVKVGFARDPVRRYCSLQIGNPYKLHPIGVVPGLIQDESYIHRKLEPTRLRGEWFLPSDQLNEMIEALDPFPKIPNGVL